MSYSKNQIKDSVERVQTWILKNKRTPATVGVSKDTLSWAKWKQLPEIKDAEQRLKDWIVKNKAYPTYVVTCDVKIKPEAYKIIWTDLPTPNTTTNAKTNDIKPNTEYNTFVKYFGKVTTIDEALKKIENHGYGHYYNNKLTNVQTIKNLATKGATKPNCTDSCQAMQKIGIALGYTVRAVHVKCKSSGEGHVRLQFKHSKHTGGKWINRDPASVISTGNNNGVTGIWCANGTILAYNPSWYTQDLNK